MAALAVFPNVGKEETQAVLQRIIAFCQSNGVQLMLPKGAAEFFGCEQYSTEHLRKQPFDCAVSIGGDGTFLGVCRNLYGRDIPVCGVNIGTFGFLPDIEVDELEKRLDMILQGQYATEDRMVLSGAVRSGGKSHFLGHAMNEVVVTKGGVARMLHLGLSVNGCHISDYKADGLIVSTPMGSTAYSLSAGGPIVNPHIKAMILTPICPHSFTIRPMAIDEGDEVGIHIAAVHQDIIVTFDGQESFPLLPGDEVIVRRAHGAVPIVKFKDKDYYQTLLKKLWR
jgi:NAD+ kinase